ncbi:MAG: CDP-alcohol phosphatidyltransferase family protein, partial [Anaerolineales bacterium]
MADPAALAIERDPALVRLHATWRNLAGLTIVALLSGFLLLQGTWGQEPARRWTALAVLASGYQLGFLRRNLAKNRRPEGGPRLSNLGAGTAVTALRGLLLAGVGGFLFSARPPGGVAWVPTVLFTTAELLDYLDGYLARKARRLTQLGEAFDLELDNLGMLIGSGLAVWYGSLPGPFLLIGLAGYLFRFGRGARQRAGRPV